LVSNPLTSAAGATSPDVWQDFSSSQTRLEDSHRPLSTDRYSQSVNRGKRQEGAVQEQDVAMRSESHGKTRETESGQAVSRGLEKSLSMKFCEEIMKLHSDLCHGAKQMLRRSRQKLELGALDIEFQELNLSKAVSVHQPASEIVLISMVSQFPFSSCTTIPPASKFSRKKKRVAPSVGASAAFITSIEP
jgi:hypothetical protein